MNEVTSRASSAAGSPFDAIRRTREDGGEYWSARDLMPLLGYERWDRVPDVIDRAKASATASGHDAGTLFRASSEKSGGRPREDFHLSRFACYLVAMNGDPRKDQVAAAQAYFAVRTRQAETTTPTLTGPALMAAALIEAHKTIEATEQRAVKAEHVVAAITDGGGITLTQFHKHHFPDVPARAFFQHLYDHQLLIDQRGKGRWDDKRNRYREGPQHRHPTYKGKAYMYLDGCLDGQDKRREYTKVRPGQPEIDLVHLLARQGLPAALPSMSTVPALPAA
ncbi:MAG: hypothetical protein E6Z28_06130 [Actinomyces urogenitalis]|uniref:BRO family protein n=1 Tax=Actinomyces urogenitalis TaxID=103621 RepID=UPI00290BE638|nr:BRO family protein [Actinomyces urogenitalis]MDU5874594.1 hypothetical protein [Actinomyces urogenitalis]